MSWGVRRFHRNYLFDREVTSIVKVWLRVAVLNLRHTVN